MKIIIKYENHVTRNDNHKKIYENNENHHKFLKSY